jgi:riboflavin biosynthesis pyrimidine reductase
VNSLDEQPIIVFCTVESANAMPSVTANLNAAGATVLAVPSDGAGRVSLEACLVELGNRQITHLLIEPGPTLARAFIDSGTVDRIWLFQSPDISPGGDSPRAVPVPYPPVARIMLGPDELIEYLNPASLDFYIAEPSADFQLLSNPA